MFLTLDSSTETDKYASYANPILRFQNVTLCILWWFFYLFFSNHALNKLAEFFTENVPHLPPPGFKAIQTSYTREWRRSTAARRNWRRSWGRRLWLTWRLTKKWTAWSPTLCSSGRSEINTCCKLNPLENYHDLDFILMEKRFLLFTGLWFHVCF